MTTLSRKLALLEGYRPLTTPISTLTEPDIIAAVESTLTGTRSVWIKAGPELLEAARHRSELVKISKEDSE